jgi:hypothetical protein
MQSLVWLVAASGAFQQSPPPVPAWTPPRVALSSVMRLPSDSGQRRPRAVEYSNFYSVRLTIHRYASFATLPLFVAEYALGRSLYNTPPDSVSGSVRSAHGAVAVGIAGLFAINTVTGGWNLWDARKDPADRTRRYVHAALMLVSDAGFVATGALAPSRRAELAGTIDPNRRSLHRTVAIASMSTALAGYLMMLIWRK